MLVVGLTGGIGSGKSSVAERLAALGVPVIDADPIARELVAPGQPALAEVVASFGPGVLAGDGALDRRALRRRVFADDQARRNLEAILHPRIRAAMEARLRSLGAPYAVLVMPLLLETGQRDLCHRVLVVDLPEALQVQRVVQRDGQRPAEVEAILRAQCSRAYRRAAADDLLDNSGDRTRLLAQVDALHERYMCLARDSKNLREIPALRTPGK
jgi:dephospho-CoA kinase